MDKTGLIIIGGGPAGLTAALYGSRSGLSTLLIEGETTGGLLSEIPVVENYPGFSEGTSGLDLASKMTEQARKAGAEIHEIETAQSVEVDNEVIFVKTDRGSYSCGALILATGGVHRPLGVKGEEQLKGRGVSYCALCDGFFFRGKNVAVAGGGNSAASSALYLAGIAGQVHMIHRRGELRADEAWMKAIKNKGVHILLNREILEIKGERKLESILVRDRITDQRSELQVDGLFVEAGEIPNSALAVNVGARVDAEGFILVNNRQETSIKGVFAAGDVTSFPVKQISTAVGQGVVAATEAFCHLKQPYYRRG